MRFLEIKSEGLIAKEAFTLIGASTKRGDSSKIGMFGSGLKYGIASILRQDIPFVVFSGMEEFKFTTNEVSFGGQDFNQIHINGEKTSFTDTMGTEDWKGAFPYIREIWSNALDEDQNSTIAMVDDVKAEIGFTKFYIQANEELTQLWKDWKKYFKSKDDALAITEYGAIHTTQGEFLTVYRQGIQAYASTSAKTLFDYDLFQVEINESRVIKNHYTMDNFIGHTLEACRNKSVLRRWINGVKGGNAGVYEHNCILSEWRDLAANPELVEVILEMKYYPIEISEMLEPSDMADRAGLPIALIRRFIKYAPDMDCFGLSSSTVGDNFRIEAKPSKLLENKVANAVAMLVGTNYKDRLVAPIKYCKFKKDTVLGQAAESTIWLSVNLELKPLELIAQIIIEEQEHLTTGHSDNTRQFQDHLFELFFNELISK